MRKCIRCQAKMIENLDVKVEGRADGIKVTQPGIFKENLGRLQCAVCPQCGLRRDVYFGWFQNP